MKTHKKKKKKKKKRKRDEIHARSKSELTRHFRHNYGS